MNRSTFVRTSPSNLSTRKRAEGVTIVELLITMVIVAILASVAIPSYRYVTNANRVAAEVNGLLGDLQFARSQAIKEGATVTICVSNDGSTCTGETDWKTGWIIQSGTNGIMRKQGVFKSTDTFKEATPTLSSITFNREGFAGGITGVTKILLKDSTANNKWTRCLTIRPTGQVWTHRYGVTKYAVACP